MEPERTMLVTQHARHTALYRALVQHEVTAALDRVEFHKLDRDWERNCGLRRADLLNSIKELELSGVIVQRLGSEGALIELTDRGALQMPAAASLFRGFRWSQPVDGLLVAINSASILARARKRCSRRSRASGTAIVDRRSRA